MGLEYAFHVNPFSFQFKYNIKLYGQPKTAALIYDQQFAIEDEKKRNIYGWRHITEERITGAGNLVKTVKKSKDTEND